MGLLFAVGVVAVFILAATVLAQVRQRLEVGDLWYGLVPIGAAGALVAMLVQGGLLIVYAQLAGLPSEMPRSELVQRWDLLLLNTVVLAVLIEASKMYAVHLVHTRLERGNWALYGMALGAGAGLLQALLKLGPRAYVGIMGTEPTQLIHLWLLPQSVALVAMEVALGGVLLYRSAEGRPTEGLMLAGGLHAAALLGSGVLMRVDAVQTVLPAIRTGLFTTTALIAAVILASWVKRKGWPF
ncbi:MAG: hypothetical protein AAFX99_03160 [Myxococcota bacterium]